MKKNRRETREFQVYKEQLKNIQNVISNTKVANLWTHEAAVRKKLKALNEMQGDGIKGFSTVQKEYRNLLDEISKKFLEDYNKKNNTNFLFEQIIKEHEKEYVSSGLIPVLVTHHIPKMVTEEFAHYLPADPKDEYSETRGEKRTIILHLGETNTGKTYQAIERMKECNNGIYLAPLRILALEIYERLSEDGVLCNLRTGEEEIITDGARHESATVEKLELEQEYEVAVIDEIQMIGDSQRGAAWTRALLGIRCPEIHVCGAYNAKELLIEIIESCGDEYEIKEYVRAVPLQIEPEPFHLNDAREGDALIVFSKKRVLEVAKLYKEQKIGTSMIYGDLPPEVRKLQYHAFVEGKSKVLVSTDAIGMGVNLPIRRIVFMNIKKFDGEEVRYLTSQEVKQIGGRAGRKGIYEIGYVAVMGEQYDFIREKIEKEDPHLEKAVIGPSEVLLKMKGLPLREKIALWSTREEQMDMYRKMDVRDYIFILDKIRTYKLEEKAEWKLMRLPFDVHNEKVFSCFIEYVEQYFIRKSKILSKPIYDDTTLEAYETYYQKVNLYYSFSKNFRIPFEEEWVYEERIRISESINQKLQYSIVE